jgi:23S rRNA pseudouridine2605 synthase/23S rRNA pseudouridine2604 synthase
MRLQKFLSAAGFCSRRKGEEYIKAGLVTVNGQVVTELGSKVDSQTDRIEVNGKLVQLKQDLVYIALNKPTGYIASCRRSRADEKIVIDLLDIPQRVYPVGRLDKDSTGLLILTNDGRVHHRILHPSFDHEKEYEVTVAGPITDSALQKIRKGLPMMGTKTRSAKVSRISLRRFRIVLQEGKNRQIRRMVRKVGNRVVKLNRIRIANIILARLKKGRWRFLSPAEIRELQRMLQK